MSFQASLYHVAGLSGLQRCSSDPSLRAEEGGHAAAYFFFFFSGQIFRWSVRNSREEKVEGGRTEK